MTGSEVDQPKLPHAIFYVDVETTGLDPDRHHILELSYVVTRFAYPYEPLGPRGTYLQEDGHIFGPAGADDYVRQMHVASGLWRDLAPEADTFKTTLVQMEKDLLELSARWPMDKDERVMIGGNSPHFDLGFLRKYLPSFAARLSHRTFDASGLYRSCLSLGMPALPKHEEAHRAREDVRRSIELARTCGRWILTAPKVAT